MWPSGNTRQRRGNVPRKILEYGGYISGALLIVFGIVAIYMGVDGRSTVRDSIKQEQIFFGARRRPAVAEHADQWSEEQVLTGDQARAFALIMRDHALEGSEGLTYAQMGRFVSAENPDDPAGTSDEAAALKGDDGHRCRTPPGTPGSPRRRSRPR